MELFAIFVGPMELLFKTFLAEHFDKFGHQLARIFFRDHQS
jgi:hypothetical protein